MARKKVSYKGASPRKIKYQSQEKLADDFLVYQVDRPQFYNEVEGFTEYFLAQVANVTVNLAAGAVTVSKKKLLESETPWGQARIRGEYFGVQFRPYGKGPGRYDTGNMFNALKITDANASSFVGSKELNMYVEYGYDTQMDRGRNGGPYFLAQERGFLNPFSFDPDQTRLDGVARFGIARKPRRVKGARALEAGAESIKKRIDSGLSAAWNEAKKLFESDGFAVSGVGTYINARDAYRMNPPKTPSLGKNPGYLGLLSTDGPTGFFKVPGGGPAEERRRSNAIAKIDRLFKFKPKSR